MRWIVIGEENGKITMVSKNDGDGTDGLIYNGTYLTIENEQKQKFILRVDESSQVNPYTPSPLIADMNLPPLIQDQLSRNLIRSERIIEIPGREGGVSSFIKPQSLARLSTQEEIDYAIGNSEGMPLFLASAFGRNSQILRDFNGKYVVARVPQEVFFHQMMITGRTGSGKTVAMKYMSQYFTENEIKTDNSNSGILGSVLAVNVKEEDLLRMDKGSNSYDDKIEKEWDTIGLSPHGTSSYRIYYPGNSLNHYSQKVDRNKCIKITLKTKNLEPDTLTGLVQNLSSQGSDHLPAIFRYWKELEMKNGDTLDTFLKYFSSNKDRKFYGMNIKEQEYEITLHPGTFQNVQRTISKNTQYFDVEDAIELSAEHILEPGKMSVLDLSDKDGLGFGSVLLRDILEKIYEKKSDRESKVPVLVIIDEVHEFYGNVRSREALETLDAITRKGRSLGIGVIFSSQNPEDMPKGISSVVNTKLHFRSDSKTIGIKFTGIDPESLHSGYSVVQIYGMNQLKLVKFPLSLSGVLNE
ncbi:MAG: ATP-binding protein [Cuniculiplasma sp.]|jgi:hypothetical protein